MIHITTVHTITAHIIITIIHTMVITTPITIHLIMVIMDITGITTGDTTMDIIMGTGTDIILQEVTTQLHQEAPIMDQGNPQEAMYQTEM
mgnify:FL=1